MKIFAAWFAAVVASASGRNLRSAVKLIGALAQDNVTSPDSLASMERSLVHMARSGKFGDSGITDAVKAMIGMVNDMMPKVTQNHDLAQKTLDDLYGAVIKCKDTVTIAHTGAVGQQTARTVASKNHKDCRDDESKKITEAQQCTTLRDAKKATKDAACSALDAIKSNPSDGADECHPASSEDYGVWVTRLSQSFGKKAADYAAKKSACDDAINDYTIQTAKCVPLQDKVKAAKTTCDSMQSALETVACDAARVIVGSCDIYTACYDSKVQSLNDQKGSIEKLEKSRKGEWRGLKRMECLLAAMQAGEVKEADIDACKGKDHATKHLDLKYGTMPDPDTCDAKNLPSYPCGSAFLSDEYSNLPADVSILDCQPCSGMGGGGLQPPPNFKMRCQHEPGWDYVLDYSDDRSKDDLPTDLNLIAAGFANENAYYIGNNALEALDIEKAEVCALASGTRTKAGKCQWSCKEFTDNNFGSSVCPTCNSLTTPLKKIIAGVSGQATSGAFTTQEPRPGAAFQEDMSDVHWFCNQRTFMDGRNGWHQAGYGITMRIDRGAGAEEIGWHHDNTCNWRGRVDVDTVQVRVQSKAKPPPNNGGKLGWAPTVFKERCKHESDWTYILDYSDDRATDDFTADRNVIAAGFDNSHGFFIGTDILKKLDIKEAEMCALSSTTRLPSNGGCQWSCVPLKDSYISGQVQSGQTLCSRCSDLDTPLKNIIAGLSGLWEYGEILDTTIMPNVYLGNFQEDKVDVQWSCGNYPPMYAWFNGWHKQGAGISVRLDHGANTYEVGYERDGYCRNHGFKGQWVDVDTFQIRVKL